MEAGWSHLDGWVVTDPHAHVSVSLACDVFLGHVYGGQRNADPSCRGEQQEVWVHTLVVTLGRRWLKC